MTIYTVPLSAEQQTFAIQLGDQTYQLTLRFADVDQGGWLLDIEDENEQMLLAGIPLVTGHDLLEQFEFLGIGGQLIVFTEGGSNLAPGYADLGASSNLYFVTS